MSLRVVTMGELRLEVLLEPEKTGRSVAEVCRRRGVSRETFYEYRRRYAKEGPPASNLGPDSPQRPRPRSTSIWRWRSAACGRIIHVGERGGSEPSFDAPVSIRQPSPPSTKCFRRNHLVTDQPSKRPKATKRFEREVPNDLWQIDATKVHLEDGTEVWVVDALDDHARFLLAARVDFERRIRSSRPTSRCPRSRRSSSRPFRGSDPGAPQATGHKDVGGHPRSGDPAHLPRHLGPGVGARWGQRRGRGSQGPDDAGDGEGREGAGAAPG